MQLDYQTWRRCFTGKHLLYAATGHVSEFNDKLNLAIFDFTERSGAAKDAQIKSYLACLHTMMTTWSNMIRIVKAQASTLASGNHAAVKMALEDWWVKTAK